MDGEAPMLVPGGGGYGCGRDEKTILKASKKSP